MAKKKLKPTPESIAYDKYLSRTGFAKCPITTALIDMDGVLFNSMPNHSRAWERLAEEYGWKYEPNEFFLYEGMTGAATIRLMMSRIGRNNISDDEAREIYAKKSKYFVELGEVGPIDGTAEMLNSLRSAGIARVLVTGSGQASLLERVNAAYPGVFSDNLKVTAHDVRHGKPDPEPYLMGLKKAGAKPENAIVIENAPLGVKSGSASRCFTVGITTGPVPQEQLSGNGADIVYPTMRDFADGITRIIAARNFSF